MHNAFLTILAIREVRLPSGSFAQVLSWCGGGGKAKRCCSWSGGWRRNLWSILVCLGCAETVTCKRVLRSSLERSSEDHLLVVLYHIWFTMYEYKGLRPDDPGQTPVLVSQSKTQNLFHK